MSDHWPLFMFLAASGMALFFFFSIAAWSGAQSAQNQARDRYALLRALAEQPGENAKLVLDMLREQDEKKAWRKAEDERRGFLMGSLTCIASGIGLVVMFLSLGTVKAWPVGLIPLLVGIALAPFGLTRKAMPSVENARK